MKRKLLTLVMVLFTIPSIFIAQCTSESNIYSFVYNGKTYEVVKENKNWVDAATCAVKRGGYLAEINSLEEQNKIFSQLNIKAGINTKQTVSVDGGSASYLWLGGNDLAEEGKWILDGNNDGSGPQFWQGLSNGSAVGGLYNNWGHEPDNWNDIQDALAIAITEWPLGSGALGKASQWNDLDKANLLY